jgi:hypothetical protein
MVNLFQYSFIHITLIYCTIFSLTYLLSTHILLIHLENAFVNCPTIGFTDQPHTSHTGLYLSLSLSLSLSLLSEASKIITLSIFYQ